MTAHKSARLEAALEKYQAVRRPSVNRCTRCGSDDLQKADDMALTLAFAPTPETMDDYMTRAREASRLRVPHMNGTCRSGVSV